MKGKPTKTYLAFAKHEGGGEVEVILGRGRGRRPAAVAAAGAAAVGGRAGQPRVQSRAGQPRAQQRQQLQRAADQPVRGSGSASASAAGGGSAGRGMAHAPTIPTRPPAWGRAAASAVAVAPVLVPVRAAYTSALSLRSEQEQGR